MHDGLPDRHLIAIHGFFDGRHLCAACAQQPPDDGGDARADDDGNRTAQWRHVKRTGFMRALHIAKRKTLDAVQHERQQTGSRTDGDADDDYRRDQCREPAE